MKTIYNILFFHRRIIRLMQEELEQEQRYV